MICGSPCRSKFCKDCAKEAYRRKYNKHKVKFKGCDEDCENCPYPDCLKPANQIKKETDSIRKMATDAPSQQKMYTVCWQGEKYYR